MAKTAQNQFFVDFESIWLDFSKIFNGSGLQEIAGDQSARAALERLQKALWLPESSRKVAEGFGKVLGGKY